MDFEDDDDSFERENPQTFDENDEEEAPAKRPKKSSETDTEDMVNEKRGYTSKERDMIEEWLRKNKPKSDEKEQEKA